ncbi:biotin/lipoyl-containing protein [Intestinibacter sp.]
MIKQYNVTVNGNLYKVEVEEVGSAVSDIQQAAPVAPKAVPTPKKAAPAPKKTAPVATGGATVQAPMPGKVLDVKTSVGAQVKNGDVLLILEAMKMENEIVANADGTIQSIEVSTGSNVNAGDVLIVIG